MKHHLLVILAFILVHILIFGLCTCIGFCMGHDLHHNPNFDLMWIPVILLMILFERIAIGLYKEILL